MLDSPQVQGAVRKAIAAITGFILALVLLIALLISGFYLLVKAASLAMTPLLGEAGALAVTGFSCFLLLALFFYRMTRPVSTAASGNSDSATSGFSPIALFREIIKKNPLESAFTAFAVGVVEQSDPRLQSLLLQGGMVLMKEAEAERSKSSESPAETTTPEEEPEV